MIPISYATKDSIIIYIDMYLKLVRMLSEISVWYAIEIVCFLIMLGAQGSSHRCSGIFSAFIRYVTPYG